MKRFILLLLLIIFLPGVFVHAQSESMNETIATWYDNFGNQVDNAFYFVVDKIIDLQNFFLQQARHIGYIVLLIAILTTALNYALTGTGLKENIIKIIKATVFFIIVIFAYPNIISFITSWTFRMAHDSIYPSVKEYFDEKTEEVTRRNNFSISTSAVDGYGKNSSSGAAFSTFFGQMTYSLPRDKQKLFSNIEQTHPHPQMNYTTVAPAAVIRIILAISGECIKYADESKRGGIIHEFSRVLKGLICAFFAILTGIFALLEYIVCFLEFMLIASVGVILFPLSLWEGSKFMSEKFIGAMLGFFIKLLFCNIAIFLLLYGFVSLFYIISGKGFQGQPDQIIFIIFTCLLFFFICKSIPGIAQSLLTGTPSLNAAGAIGAVAGVAAAAGATMHMAKNMGSAAGNVAKTVGGGAAKTAFGASGALSAASGAAKAVAGAGGTGGQQAGAFMRSIAGSAGSSIAAGAYGLTRSLMGGSNLGSNPHSWQDDFNKFVHKGGEKDGEQMTYKDYRTQRKNEGAENALAHYNKKHSSQQNTTAPNSSSKSDPYATLQKERPNTPKVDNAGTT